MMAQMGGRKTPLCTSAGEAAYRALMETGPIARIFKDEKLRLAPAKGSRAYREQDPLIFEQTYFAHALSVSITAGILFETAATPAGGPATERELRVVLASGSLHDFNKLTVLTGGLGLSKALVAKEPELRALLEGYVDDKDVEDVLHLILDTEPTTSGASPRYEMNMAPRRAMLAAWCLQLADQLAGSGVDPNDPESYRRTVEKFRAKWPAIPEIRVRTFALLPQAALARAARQSFLDWIREHGMLLHESERYVSWMGPEPTPEDLAAMDEGLWARIAPEPEKAFEKAPPTHNKIPTTWAESVLPTPEIVDHWIEHTGGRMVLWQGDWGLRHLSHLQADFPGIFVYDKAPKDRVRLVLQRPDASADQSYQNSRRIAKLVIAHCVFQTLSDPPTRTSPPGPHGPYETEDLEGVMGRTVPGILWARHERVKPESYDGIVERLAALIVAQYPSRENPVRGVFAALIGQAPSLSVGPTGGACVYCGAAATRDVEKAVVFGLKPTAWAPRKKGVQREAHKGAICELCVVENQVRDETRRRYYSPDSEAGYLTAHIHAADLVVDVKWGALKDHVANCVDGPDGPAVVLVPLLRSKSKPDTGVSTKQGQLVPLRGHVSIPFPRPKGGVKASDTFVELLRFRDVLRFARDTGFKVHVTPLALVPSQERAHVKWTNPPTWMQDLGLAEVHVDDLRPNGRPSALEIVDSLIQAGGAAGGKQSHTAFLSRFIRNPLALYETTASGPVSADRNHIEILEEAFVSDNEKESLKRVALAFINFNARGEWTNNTWTWAPRQYLELRERYRNEPGWKDLVVGDLHRSASSKNKGATLQQVEAFADAFEDYLAGFRTGAPPIGSDQRVLISAIAYRCKKHYRDVFPKGEKS